MKRVLLATTALGMGAGVAFAQDAGMADDGMMEMAPPITLGGVAEMGVAGSSDDSVRFHNDVNLTFTMSGTTDAGVTFGTAIELSDIENAAGRNTTNNDDHHGGIAVHMSDPDGFGTLTLGETDGAFDWAMTEVNAGGGLRAELEHSGWNGNSGIDGRHDDQVLRWDRAIGSGFSMAASVELDDDTDGKPGGSTHDPIVGIGGQYAMPMGGGSLTIGAGYQMGSFDVHVEEGSMNGQAIWGAGYESTPAAVTASTGAVTPSGSNTLTGHEVDGTIVGGSVVMDFGNGLATTLNASVGEMDGTRPAATASGPIKTLDGERTYLGGGLSYTVGAISLQVNAGTNVSEYTVDANSRATATNDVTVVEYTDTGVGFSAGYDLGGGATLTFGVGSSEKESDWNYQSATAPGAPSSVPAGRTLNNVHDRSTDTNKWSLGVTFAF